MVKRMMGIMMGLFRYVGLLLWSLAVVTFVGRDYPRQDTVDGLKVRTFSSVNVNSTLAKQQ